MSNETTNRILAIIVSSLGGVAVCYGLSNLLLMFFAGSPLAILVAGCLSLLFGMLFYMAIKDFLELFDTKSEKKKEVVDLQEKIDRMGDISGISKQDLLATFHAASDKVQLIREASVRLTSNSLRTKLLDLANVGYQIIREITNDPKDYRIARSWLNTQLSQTVTVVQKFTELENPPAKTVEEFENTLDHLLVSFNKLFDDLKSNDVDELTINMSVLKEITKS